MLYYHHHHPIILNRIQSLEKYDSVLFKPLLIVVVPVVVVVVVVFNRNFLLGAALLN